MLKNVKAMILEKKEYLEAAEIIFEDAMGSNIDDLIILGESADLPKEDDDIPTGKEDDDNDGNKNKEDDDDDDKDLDNLPFNDGDNDADDMVGSKGTDDILDSSIEDDEIQTTLSDTDDLPIPVGAQTGQPIVDDIDDFLNVTIDLGSNTLTDVLPIPPSNAGEAIADDVLSTRVDSGFQEDGTPAPVQSTDPAGAAAGFPMDEDTDDILKESVSDTNLMESITLGGDTPAEGDGAGDGTTPSDDGAGDVPTEGGEGESEVTAAVKDKVAEADTPIEGGGMQSGKEDLLKKLGSITKSLEDAKKAVMNTIQ